jgi:hypothetical protein
MMKARLFSLLLASAFSLHPSTLLGVTPSLSKGQPSALRSTEVLRSTAALPPHIVAAFQDIAACHLSPEGDYLVFDRRAHSVYRASRTAEPRKVIEIGVEAGRLLRPLAFDSHSEGTFVIADAPTGVERIQVFFYLGGTIGGFTLPGRSVPRVTLGDFVLSGIGSLDYTGRSVLVSQPDSGTLITEYALDGRRIRSLGELRATGHETERDLHLALNAGIPLAIPGGGYYFVFLSGVPMYRKYDAAGTLVFERHIEGAEIDKHIQSLPRQWPLRKTADGEFPVVPPSVRTAAVAPDGRLWISLVTPYTYVYDEAGDKRRAIEFRAAGSMAPSNFYFAADGRLLIAPGCYTFSWKSDHAQ